MARGGKRENAGRKDTVSPYGEKTDVIRVPKSIKADVLTFLDSFKALAKEPALNHQQASLNPTTIMRPLYSGKVSAGASRFPSPAQDYEQKFLDLNDRYIKNPPATFFFQVTGDSMTGIGIFKGSMLIVDRSITAKSSSIVVASLEGELMVKRLYKRGGVVKLLSENPDYAPIEPQEGQELTVFGVVTGVINEPK